MQAASRVGALLVVFGGLALGAYQFIGKPILEPKSDVYYAVFKDAGGIPPGTKILMAGVQIGSVESIELAKFTEARVALRVLAPHRIPSGSRAVIGASLTGLGDNPIVITPPNSPRDLLVAGDTIPGVRAGALDNLLPPKLLEEMTQTLAATRKILENQKMFEHVDELIVSTNQTLTKFDKLAESAQGLTGQVNSTMANNQSNINLAIRSLAQTMANVNATSLEVAKLIKEGKFQKESLALLGNLNNTVTESQKLIKDLDKTLNDPEIKGPMKGTLANVEKITDSGTRIAKNTEEMTKNGITISSNVADLTKKANELAESSKELLDKLKRALDKSPFGGGGGAKAPLGSEVKANMNLLRESSPNRWRTDLDIRFPYENGAISLGLFDAFESNKVTAQVVRPLTKKMDLRMGVYASKPGAGFDYQIRPGFSFVGDVFDLNKPRFDFRTKFELQNGTYGWLGLQKIGSRNAPVLGIGIRK